MKGSIFIGAVAAALLAGCAGQPAQTPGQVAQPRQDDAVVGPDWFSGESARYPSALYLLGRGSGGSLEAAKDRARADLAKVFAVNVRERSSDTQEFSRQVAQGETTERSGQQVTRFVVTDTEQLLRGVEIGELAYDEKRALHYALAVLSRQQARASLRQQIHRLDTETNIYLERTRIEADPLKKIAAGYGAVQAQRERAMLQQSLQVVDPSGEGIAPIWNPAWLEGEVGKLLGALQINPRAEGTALRTQLAAALSGAGFQAAEAGAGQYTLSAALSQETPEHVEGWHWQRGRFELVLTDMGGAVVGRQQWNLKVAARQRDQLAGRLQDEVAAILDQELRDTVLGFVAKP